MIDYTTQDKLGRFSERWGCYATCLINIIETEKNRSLSEFERYASIGAMFVGERVLLSNYKNHENVYGDIKGWGAVADPELHFLVVNQNKAIRGLLDAFNIPNLKHTYEILKLSTRYGFHFILGVDGDKMVNPDPSLDGTLVQRRKIEI